MITQSGTFTATGSTSAQNIAKGDASISGTFVGTVDLERRLDGTNWVVVESFTEPTEKSILNGSEWPMRLTCSAYTSGTVTYTLST